MTQPSPAHGDDLLVIAGKPYRSRLLTGTGKYRDLDETRRATEAAGAEIENPRIVPPLPRAVKSPALQGHGGLCTIFSWQSAPSESDWCAGQQE